MGGKRLVRVLFERYNKHVESSIMSDRKSQFALLLKVAYLIDVLLAFVIHGSSLNDYFIYEFHKIRGIERRTFVTHRKAKKIFKTFLVPEFRGGFGDKFELYRRYSKFLGRDWLYPRQSDLKAFCAFCLKHNSFVVKPRFGSLGRGVYIENTTGKNLDALFTHFRKQDVLIEEVIIQHCRMASLHPQSVNTVRVTAVQLKSGLANITAALRMGNKGMSVDNRSAGGIAAALNLEDGFVYTTGVDKFSNRYVRHPMTGIRIPGFEVPHWDEVLSLIKDASDMTPGAAYGGWDIAITETGPVLIEVNYQGAMGVQQQPDLIGKWPVYRKLLATYAEEVKI